MLASVLLLAVAVWSAWRPAETAAETAAVVAAAVVALTTWAWRRSRPEAVREWQRALPPVAVLLVLSGAQGWDPATAAAELALVWAVVALVWLASRRAPGADLPRLLAVGLSALSLWALWQVTVGFEHIMGAVGELPEAYQANAVERLTSGRGFASLPLPGHLAALLATALPLLATGIARRRISILWGCGIVLCLTGLVLTRSPIGIALALAGTSAVFLRRRRWAAVAGGVLLGVMLVAVVSMRADVGRLEPVRLRLDNWRTAVWLASTAPAAGVGVGSYAQASQAVPFDVGNRPAHAHCLPLEWVAELGVVGAVAFVLFAVWLVRVLRQLWRRDPGLAVAVAIVPIHNLVDFSLYVSGVALPWAVLVGWAVASSRPSPAPVASEAPARVVTVAVAVVALAVAVLHGTSVAVGRAATSTRDLQQRIQLAHRAHALAPWRVHALQQVGAIALEANDHEQVREAADLVRAWRWLRPRSASLATLASNLAMVDGAVPTAVSEIWVAATGRPFDVRTGAHLEGLLDRLDEEADDHR